LSGRDTGPYPSGLELPVTVLGLGGKGNSGAVLPVVWTDLPESMTPRSRGMIKPEVYVDCPQMNERAQGMPGVSLHPQPCVRW
jgi:hypothetical protein